MPYEHATTVFSEFFWLRGIPWVCFLGPIPGCEGISYGCLWYVIWNQFIRAQFFDCELGTSYSNYLAPQCVTGPPGIHLHFLSNYAR